MAIDESALLNAGISIFWFFIVPFWAIYLFVLLITRGRVRSIVGLIGLTMLSSCVSWMASSGYAQQVTPEHAVISNWTHRPRLWLTVVLSTVAVLAVATALRNWFQSNRPAAWRTVFMAAPAVGAYVAYTWTMIAYYGFAALFRP